MTASTERVERIPPLHLIMDERVFGEPGFVDLAARLMAVGGSRLAVHLRSPTASGAELCAAGVALSAAANESGAVLLVNDRVDVALAVDAAGVQLPAHGMPAAAARRVLGPAPIIGASVHSVQEATAAVEAADFLIAGTLFDSASHPGRAGAGVALVPELVSLGLPVIGIGGITPARVPEVLGAGAHGVAVLGAVWHAGDPAAAIVRLLDLVQ